ncbi:MAG: hypothetical protein IJT30_09735, partial [Muribaculaceae bacterium]|nr:hypothetical protein [Muribaculaceae bacterium]
ADPHHQPTWWQRKKSNAASALQLVTSPLGTFITHLRFIGRMFPGGEGNLYNRFQRQVTDASHAEWRNYIASLRALNQKAAEIFGHKWGGMSRFTLTDLWRINSDSKRVTVNMRGKPYTITQTGAVALWLTERQADGRMKLRYMGIDENEMNRVTAQINPDLIRYFTWVTEEFLPQMRERINETYIDMFGADMDNIEHYFPLVINTDDVPMANPVGQGGAPNRPSTLTGGIIKRSHNNKAVDFTRNDAVDILLNHMQTMEHWAQFAPIARDLNTLLNYKRFRSVTKNMPTWRFGSGLDAFEDFRKCCAIVTGDYVPAKGKADQTVNKAMSLYQASRIAGRLFTATKQLQSGVVALKHARIDDIMRSALQLLMPNPDGSSEWGNTWKWAMENLPTFAERWQSRRLGDTSLEDFEAYIGGKTMASRARHALGYVSILPNAAVDAITVAAVGRAVYLTQRRKYLNWGFDRQKAEHRALQDASAVVNESQQSSQGMYRSVIQTDRTVYAKWVSMFRNASMSYTRKVVQGYDELTRYMHRGAFSESVRRTTDLLTREGLDPAQAAKVARRLAIREPFKGLATLAMYGFILPATWSQFGIYAAHRMAGDDDYETMGYKLLKSLGHLATGAFEGLVGGSTLSSLGEFVFGKYALDDGKEWRDFFLEELPIIGDANKAKNKIDGKKQLEAYYDIARLALSITTGVDPAVVTDAYAALADYCGKDPQLMNEGMLLFARIANTPQSVTENSYIAELMTPGRNARKLTPDEFARRFAKYKRLKAGGWLNAFASEEMKRDIEDAYVEKFGEAVKERLAQMTDEELTQWGQQSGQLELAGKELLKRDRQANEKPKDEQQKSEDKKKEGARARARFFSPQQLDSAYNAEADSVTRRTYRQEIQKQDGVKPSCDSNESNATKAYKKVQTADDIRADDRIKAYKAKLAEIEDQYHSAGGTIGMGGVGIDSHKKSAGLVDTKKLGQLHKQYADQLKALINLKKWDTKLKQCKERLLKGEDPDNVMKDLRDYRQKLLDRLKELTGQ